MEVIWRMETPPTDIESGMSKQLVVMTNLGYLNTGYYSSRTCRWSLEGMTMRKEHVIAWLDGLQVEEREQV